MKDQIEKLKAELRGFIELAKTITPGKWKYNEGHRMAISVDSLHENPVLWGYEYDISDMDAAFIARSRNISPAMAECLLVAVEAITSECPHGCLPHCPHHRAMEPRLQQILAIWEAAK